MACLSPHPPRRVFAARAFFGAIGVAGLVRGAAAAPRAAQHQQVLRCGRRPRAACGDAREHLAGVALEESTCATARPAGYVPSMPEVTSMSPARMSAWAP